MKSSRRLASSVVAIDVRADRVIDSIDANKWLEDLVLTSGLLITLAFALGVWLAAQSRQPGARPDSRTSVS
jgi:hypothetical protein